MMAKVKGLKKQAKVKGKQILTYQAGDPRIEEVRVMLFELS